MGQPPGGFDDSPWICMCARFVGSQVEIFLTLSYDNFRTRRTMFLFSVFFSHYKFCSSQLPVFGFLPTPHRPACH
jgi:hypothetical protein